jgi:hypothetical protein
MFKASAPIKKVLILVFKTKKQIKNYRETVPLRRRSVVCTACRKGGNRSTVI